MSWPEAGPWSAGGSGGRSNPEVAREVSPRSCLYVPANQPRMLVKALQRGADAVIVDLEDSVPPSARTYARQTLAEWLEEVDEGEPTQIWVRIGAPGDDGEPAAADIAAAVHPRVSGVVQAKAHGVPALARLDAALCEAEDAAGVTRGSTLVAALIESPQAVLEVRAIAGAPRVRRLQLGEADLVASLGMAADASDEELRPVRLAIVVATAAAGLLPAIGPVERRLGDPEGLRRSSDALRRMGFGGRAAVHPSQVPIINEVFSPSPGEVAWAKRLLEANAMFANDGVAVDEEGRIVDRAVMRSALAVVRRAEAVECRSQHRCTGDPR